MAKALGGRHRAIRATSAEPAPGQAVFPRVRPQAHQLPWTCFSYLLPHLLPSKPGLDTHGMRHPTANTIQRVFKMSFVPVGFWQRFIARMLISLAEMDLQVVAFSAEGNFCMLLHPGWREGGGGCPLLEGPDGRPFSLSKATDLGPGGKHSMGAFSPLGPQTVL